MPNGTEGPWIESPNTFLAGPVSGTASGPASFRALVPADITSAGLLPGADFSLNANAGPLTAAVGDLTGAPFSVVQYTGVNGSTVTTRTAAQMFGDFAAGVVAVGSAWLLRVINTAAGTLTLTPGTGVTIAGKTVIPGGTYTDYVCTFTSATALKLQSVGSGAAP